MTLARVLHKIYRQTDTLICVGGTEILPSHFLAETEVKSFRIMDTASRMAQRVDFRGDAVLCGKPVVSSWSLFSSSQQGALRRNWDGTLGP